LVQLPYASKFVHPSKADPSKNWFPLNSGFKKSLTPSFFMEFFRSLMDVYKEEWMFDQPAAIANATVEYINENNPVALFLAEYVEPSPNGFFTLKDARERFVGSEYYSQDAAKNLSFKITTALGGITPTLNKKFKTVNYTNAFVGHAFKGDTRFAAPTPAPPAAPAFVRAPPASPSPPPPAPPAPPATDLFRTAKCFL
jgi:hypothetical protein